MKIEVKDGYWSIKGILLDLFINQSRELIKIPIRSKITKAHNYKFSKK